MNLQANFNQFLGTTALLSKVLTPQTPKPVTTEQKSSAIKAVESYNKEQQAIDKEQLVIDKLDKRFKTSKKQVEQFKKRLNILAEKRGFVEESLKSAGYKPEDYIVGGKK